MKRICLIALAVFITGCGDKPETTRGVTDNEVIIGGIHDLSGVFAAFSTPAVRAAQQHFSAVNQAGGVHGRNIRYIVEDHGYQVPRAVQATNKLISRDNIFAMVMSLGTPHNLAAFPVMDRNNVPSIMPLALSAQMQTEGDFSQRFVFGPSYYDSVLAGVNWLAEEHGLQNLCVMYIPSDFGQEVNQAMVDAAANNDALTLKESTSHRPDESDFTGTLSRLRAAECQLVALAVAVRPIISITAAARDMGWTDVKFIVSQAGFHSAVAAAPGNATEGLYGVSAWQDIHTRKDTPETSAWITSYQQATGEFPSSGAVLGHVGAEIFVRALQAAGPELTMDGFLAAMETLNFVEPVTGVAVAMSADNHEASSDIHISRVESGIWQPLTVVRQP
ncbi:MAG: branched-chain amino acid ABC transporter substrate-binding protein [Gammaproteobacteria bacterium HGW-Gammaproteobacteria-14]|nr:MAG: branched-chain amino acid ABC transporter substrate-binding protein [Gammaproteobacteria bacterium HGW-Gammaproteobacteria-14]